MTWNTMMWPDSAKHALFRQYGKFWAGPWKHPKEEGEDVAFDPSSEQPLNSLGNGRVNFPPALFPLGSCETDINLLYSFIRTVWFAAGLHRVARQPWMNISRRQHRLQWEVVPDLALRNGVLDVTILTFSQAWHTNYSYSCLEMPAVIRLPVLSKMNELNSSSGQLFPFKSHHKSSVAKRSL